MKPLVALAALALAASAAQAGGSLKEARKLLLRGNYAEAAQMYGDLAAAGKDRAAAAVGLSRALVSQGEYDKALGVVETALKKAPESAELLARKAELLYGRGKWD